MLKSTAYAYGTAATSIGTPPEPTKAATAETVYTFAGWSPEIAEVKADATYTATYAESVRQYTVTFLDEDGETVLQSGKTDYGETPAYADGTPTKAATAQYTYTFTGWSPALATVTGDATYTAQFGSTVNAYTVTWKNDDGSVIDATTVAYGETPAHADPSGQPPV